VSLPDLVVRPDAIVFDCDGVLVDSDASVVAAWSAWAIARGLDPAAVLAVCHGQPARATVRAFVDPAGEAAALADIDRLELASTADTAALPGARDLVSRLTPDRWAVFTSANRALAVARLAAAGIPAPSVLLTADDVGRGKPHPDGYRTAIHRLGAVASRSVVVEDAPNGIAAARAAGVGTVIGIGERALEMAVDAVVADLRAVAWDGERLVIRGDARLDRETART
jgi:mannitol-1-/sugar-/sorbitol-6-phosphatase